MTDTVTDPTTTVTAPAATLRAAIDAVTLAASTDPARPALTAVQLDRDPDGALRLTATDSYRLHTARVPADLPADTPPVLVSAAALAALARKVAPARRLYGTLPVSIGAGYGSPADHRKAGVTVAGQHLPGIDGDFPNWRALFPADAATVWSPPGSITARLDAGVRAVRGRIAATVYAALATRPGGFTAKDAEQAGKTARNTMVGVIIDGIPPTATVTLRAIKANGYGFEPLPNIDPLTLPDAGALEGDLSALPVAFNPGYLADGLAAVPGAWVQGNTALKPWILLPGGVTDLATADVAALLMPVRL